MLLAVLFANGVKCIVVIFVLWRKYGVGSLDCVGGADWHIILDVARVQYHQSRCIVSGVAIYNMDAVCVVPERQYNVYELTERPFWAFFISLIHGILRRQYSDILIPILQHNQGYTIATIQYDD